MKLAALEKINGAQSITSLDRIIATFLKSGHEIILTEPEKKQLERAEYAHSLMKEFFGIKANVVRLLIKEYIISEREGYNIISDAEYIFKKVKIISPEYLKVLQGEWMKKAIEMAFADPKKFDTLPKLLKENRELWGLDKDKEEELDWREVSMARNVVIQFNPELLGAQNIDIEALRKRFKERYMNEIQEVDFENVK